MCVALMKRVDPSGVSFIWTCFAFFSCIHMLLTAKLHMEVTTCMRVDKTAGLSGALVLRFPDNKVLYGFDHMYE